MTTRATCQPCSRRSRFLGGLRSLFKGAGSPASQRAPHSLAPRAFPNSSGVPSHLVYTFLSLPLVLHLCFLSEVNPKSSSSEASLNSDPHDGAAGTEGLWHPEANRCGARGQRVPLFALHSCSRTALLLRF